MSLTVRLKTKTEEKLKKWKTPELAGFDDFKTSPEPRG